MHKPIYVTPSHRMPSFDQRVGYLALYHTELGQIIYQIRINSDRIASETWEEFYDRTYQLGLAELARRKRRRVRDF